MRGTIHRCPFALPLSPTGGGREGACYFGSLDGEDVKRIPGFRRSARWALLCELLDRREEGRLWRYYGAIKLNPQYIGVIPQRHTIPK